MISPSALANLLLTASSAWAGDLNVLSTGAPVFVVRSGEIVGPTPLTLPDLPEGKVELGFRESPLSTTAFTQIVMVPKTGVLRLEVNLPARIASSVSGQSATAMDAAVRASAVPMQTPESLSPPETPSGEIYVTSVPSGATIFLDGNQASATTPLMLRGVAVGKHTVEARTDCARASTSMTVAKQLIARADLTLVGLPGTLVVSADVSDSRVFVDGAEVGTAPLTISEVRCGLHAVAIRAPGYLETTSEITVSGGETVSLVVRDSSVSPALSNTPAPPGGVVSVLIRKEEFGTLVLDVTPLEAELAVDGIPVGAGPRSIERVAAGPHIVAGRLDGYDALSVEVLVEPRSIARATLALTLASTPNHVRHGSKPKAPSAKLIGRLALNVGVSSIALAGGAYGVARFLAANEAYGRYEAVPSDVAAEAIYANEVAPARVEAIVSGSVGVLGTIAASGLWLTTEF